MNEDTLSVNPLLEKARIPGETFTLPSRGLFYKNGELDSTVKNGEIHVLPMATFDEITLKTPDKLFSGQAIEDVFKRCIPQVLKPLELHSKDVDFLLVCLRKLSFGDKMEVSFQHDCEEAKEHNYAFSMDPFIKNAKQIDPTKIKTTFKLTLPQGQIVSLSPMRFKSTLALYQAASKTDDKMDVRQVNDSLVELFLGVIEDVDGTTDRDHITEWLSTIPAGYVRLITESLNKVSDWGPDFEVKTKCKDCEEEILITSPINPIAFFI